MSMDVKNMTADQVKAALDSLFETTPPSTSKPESTEKGTKGADVKVASKKGDSYKAPDSRLLDILSGGPTTKKETSFSELGKSGVNFHGSKLGHQGETTTENRNEGLMSSAERSKALRHSNLGQHDTSSPEIKSAKPHVSDTSSKKKVHAPEYSLGPTGVEGQGRTETGSALRRTLGLILDMDEKSRPTKTS